MTTDAPGQPPAEGEPPLRIRRRGRRVTTDPAPGSDPSPEPEPTRHSEGENDERLRGDVPPHY